MPCARSIRPRRAGSSTSMPKPSPIPLAPGAAAGANPTVVRGRAPRPALSVVPAIRAPLPPRPPRTACACPTDRTAARRKPTPRAMPRRPPDTRWPMRRRGYVAGNVDALNKAVGEQGAAGQAGATGAGGAAGSAGVAGAAGPAAPLALRVLRARRGPLGRLDLAVRQARPVPRDPPPRRCWRRRIDWRDRRGRRCRIDRSNGRRRVGRNDGARQAPRVRVLLRERRASRVLRLPSAPLRVRPRPPLPALRHQKARALRTRSRPICWPARRPG